MALNLGRTTISKLRSHCLHYPLKAVSGQNLHIPAALLLRLKAKVLRNEVGKCVLIC